MYLGMGEMDCMGMRPSSCCTRNGHESRTGAVYEYIIAIGLG